jgi:hypothetical protein
MRSSRSSSSSRGFATFPSKSERGLHLLYREKKDMGVIQRHRQSREGVAVQLREIDVEALGDD